MTAHAMTNRAAASGSHAHSENVVDSAMLALRQGAYDAQERVAGAMPAIGQFVSRMVYTTCYGLSYGVVFPVMMVARIVPKENAIVHGLVDGAIAAREQVEGWNTGTLEEDLEEEGSEAEDGETTGKSRSKVKTNHRHRSTHRAGSTKTTRSHRKR